MDAENTDRELKDLLSAMDFFQINEGIILTENSYDLFVQADKKITIMPAWDYFG